MFEKDRPVPTLRMLLTKMLKTVLRTTAAIFLVPLWIQQTFTEQYQTSLDGDVLVEAEIGVCSFHPSL